MTKISGTLAIVALIGLLCSALSADVYVNGYYRADGTYVAPYYRSSPDGSVSNNWSAEGNINPYTGAVAHRRDTASSGPSGLGGAGVVGGLAGLGWLLLRKLGA